MAIFRFVFFAFSLAFIEANDVANNQIAGRPMFKILFTDYIGRLG